MDKDNKGARQAGHHAGCAAHGKGSASVWTAVILAAGMLALSGCGGPKAGTVYEPSHQEENLYVDMTAVQAQEQEKEEKELPQVEILDSGYTITQIDESDVYPPVKTDDYGNALPAYRLNYAARISNRGSDKAMIRPTIVVKVMDVNGERIGKSRKTFRT